MNTTWWHINISVFKGTKLECSQVIAPIKNEAGEVCMYILNFEDIDALPDIAPNIEPSTSSTSSGLRSSRCQCTKYPFYCLNHFIYFIFFTFSRSGETVIPAVIPYDFDAP